MSDQRPSEDLEDLYETAPCGYVSLSPDSRIAKINQTLAGWLGWSAEELVGKPQVVAELVSGVFNGLLVGVKISLGGGQ